jgi:hypothetical protein
MTTDTITTEADGPWERRQKALALLDTLQGHGVLAPAVLTTLRAGLNADYAFDTIEVSDVEFRTTAWGCGQTELRVGDYVGPPRGHGLMDYQVETEEDFERGLGTVYIQVRAGRIIGTTYMPEKGVPVITPAPVPM